MTGWVIVLEFIFTLAMALKCYPLQPGGLIAIEAVVLGMTSPQTVYDEILRLRHSAPHIYGGRYLLHERVRSSLLQRSC